MKTKIIPIVNSYRICYLLSINCQGINSYRSTIISSKIFLLKVEDSNCLFQFDHSCSSLKNKTSRISFSSLFQSTPPPKKLNQNSLFLFHEEIQKLSLSFSRKSQQNLQQTLIKEKQLYKFISIRLLASNSLLAKSLTGKINLHLYPLLNSFQKL